jgi:gamma-glutamyltranspeptidase/glutathione hydrolase
MVSTAQYRATGVGAAILKQGGNAVDAAVAAAFALGVCEPQASGLGGQTMMLLHMEEEGKTIAMDGSSRAPSRAVTELFQTRKQRLYGHAASTVPSTPATLGYALEQYGTMTLAQVLDPVIALAEGGYQITRLQQKLQMRERNALRQRNGGMFFLKNGERSFPAGTVFRQPVLAKTLRRFADKGIEDFYLGEMADIIHRDMEEHNGLIQRDDLAKIPYPIERQALPCRYGKYNVLTMPPPGAGRSLIEILNLLKKFPQQKRNLDTPGGTLLFAEVMRRAQLDRRDRPFDPNFYPQVQDRRMTSSEYARLVAEQITKRIKTGGETTHLSVMDKAGNVVSLTQSIERVYGAKVVCADLGFLYNNYMAAFEYEDITNPYYLRPNAVPWASVAPTIIFQKSKPWLAIGSPGSERIVSTIAQVLIRLAHQSPFDAVSAPRMHCSFSGKVSLEAAYFRNDILPHLKKHGFTIDIREPFSFYLGCVQMVLNESGMYIGVADPRRDGAAGGPE